MREKVSPITLFKKICEDFDSLYLLNATNADDEATLKFLNEKREIIRDNIRYKLELIDENREFIKKDIRMKFGKDLQELLL